MRIIRGTTLVRLERLVITLMAASLFCRIPAVFAAEKPQLVLAAFNDASEAEKWKKGEEGHEKLSVEPRLPTDRNKMLKFTVLGGSYPGILNRPKADWSPYEVLSFVIWAPCKVEVCIRIDDVHSKNFQTRFNDNYTVEKGRTLIQIPMSKIAKSIDVSKVKVMMIFLSDPPKGLTLWFDDIILGPRRSENVEFIPYDQRADLIPSMEVATPHYPLGRPLAGGPLNTFVLAGVRNGREVVELMERLDMKVSLVSWDRDWDVNTWGFGDHYGDRGNKNDYVLCAKYVSSSMQGPEKFDTMLIHAPLGWDRIPAGARKSLIDRVKNRGEGLVLMLPFPGKKGGAWPEDLKGLSPLIDSDSDWMTDGGYMHQANSGRLIGKKWRTAGEHPVTRGVPLDSLPFEYMEVQKYKVADGAKVLVETEDGDPVLAVWNVGKGRVAAFAFRTRGLTPEFRIPGEVIRARAYRYWETAYSLVARTAAWTAKRELKRSGDPVQADAPAGSRDPALSCRQWKDALGGVTDWELVFSPPHISKVEVSAQDAIKPGETIKAAFTVPAGAEALSWKAELIEESWGKKRTLERRTLDLAKLDKNEDNYRLSFSSDRVRAYMAYVEITGYKDKEISARGRAEIIVTPNPKWEDYEISTWLGYGLPFLRDFEEQRMRDFGVTANLIDAWDVSKMRRQFRAGFRVHAYGFTRGMHIRNFSEAVRQYELTKDKKWLVRNPSYNDPDFLAEERKQTIKKVEGVKKFAPISMIMADETSLTSYRSDFDFDFYPANIERFRKKMQKKFGTVSALNAATGAKVESFDSLRPPTTEEARKSGTWGLWNEWRAHNDDRWADTFFFYGRIMKEIYPQSRLSVSGTQTSAVFNGIDWAKLTPAFGAISEYTGRFQQRKRMSFHPGGLKSTPWVGYGRQGHAVDFQLWTNITWGGQGSEIFWWYSLRNSDLTWCNSAKNYMRVFKEIRAGIGRQYQLANRRFSPIAVFWSPTSQRATWVEGKYGEFEKTEKEVVEALVAAGYDPFFISESDLAGGGLEKRGAKAVFLPMSLALGRGEKKGGIGILPALQKFQKAGGVVVQTHQVKYDEFLQPVKIETGFVKFDDVKKDLQAALKKQGVPPYADVSSPDGRRIPGLSACVHEFPGEPKGSLLTILRAPVGTKDEVGADGVIHTVPDKSGGKEIEPCVVDVSRFPRGSHFFDIRSSRELTSKGGKLKIDVRAGDGRPIAVLPYGRPSLQAASKTENGNLVITWNLSSPGTANFVPHAVRVTVTDAATGEIKHAYTTNATTPKNGSGKLEFPLSLEDESKKFAVKIKDVLTGVTATAGEPVAKATKIETNPGAGKGSGISAAAKKGQSETAAGEKGGVSAGKAVPARTRSGNGNLTRVLLIAAGIIVAALIVLLKLKPSKTSGGGRKNKRR